MLKIADFFEVGKPTYRFKSGFTNIGAQVKTEDNRSVADLRATIKALMKKHPEVQKFEKDLKKMNPKHLGVVSDTLEIAGIEELIPTGINICKKNKSTNKSILENLMENFPKASKENPGALNFAQEVINNTDSITSKYFLTELLGVICDKKTDKYFEAAKPMVKEFAEQALSGGYTADYSKQELFMSYIKTLVNPKANISKVKLMPKLFETAYDLPIDEAIDISKFVSDNSPVERVIENLEVVKDVAKLTDAKGTRINIVDFVNNNVNLV